MSNATEFFYFVFVALAVFMTVVGFILLNPTWSAACREFCSRAWHIERFFYRHHRLGGVLVVSLSISLLYILSYHSYGGESGTSSPTLYLNWAVLIVRIFSVFLWFALLVGVIVVFRPSLLKPLEAMANRTISHLDNCFGTPLLMASLSITSGFICFLLALFLDGMGR